jgi:DNA-binding GntR family transcriptional regulator
LEAQMRTIEAAPPAAPRPSTWDFLPKVPIRDLREEALVALRNAIITGELTPGQRLTERDIAAAMQMSRGPVREAIRQLDREGFVQFVPRRGAVVMGVPEDEVPLVASIRAAIEEHAARGACSSATDQDLTRIEQACEALSRVDPANRAELDERDLEFHRLIVEVGASALTQRIWWTLVRVIRAYRIRNLIRTHEPTESEGIGSDNETPAMKHRRLFEAIQSRDCDLAGSLARHH